MRKSIYWWLYQPYKWLFFIPFAFLNSFFFGILAITLSYLINDRIGSKVGGQWWSRLNAFLTHMHVDVRHAHRMDANVSYVIVANHQSIYDVFLLYGWLKNDIKWVMKKEVRKIPGVGFGSAAVGHIFIDRSDTKKALESINEAKAKVKNGTSVIFFPEGTRSKDGRLKPFKKGAFRFALELGVPILPITIKGTNKIMPPGGLDVFPGKAELIIHEPVDITNEKVDDMRPLIEKVRTIIASAM